MIKNSHKLKKFEDRLIRDTGTPSYPQALNQFTSLWLEAVTLGVFPPKDPFEGLEVDIKLARVLNACLKNS